MTAGGSERHADAWQAELGALGDHQPADGRMQVHVLVRVGVVERQAGRGEGRELGADLGRELPADARPEEVAQAQAELVGREPARPRPTRCGDFAGRQHGRAFDDDEMQADAQARHRAGAAHRVGGGGAGDHQAGWREHAVAVGALDRLVDRLRQAEIVGGEDDAIAGPPLPVDGRSARRQAARRSRRNWKNSTPSRRRRFIICGLRIISPRIETIFDGRK